MDAQTDIVMKQVEMAVEATVQEVQKVSPYLVHNKYRRRCEHMMEVHYEDNRNF